MFHSLGEDSRHCGFFTKAALSSKYIKNSKADKICEQGFVVNAVPPFSEADIRTINRATRSEKDPGFCIMKKYRTLFTSVLGEDAYQITLMNAHNHNLKNK